MAETLYMLGAEPITALSGSELHAAGSALVFLNGNLLGVHRRPHRMVQAIRWGISGASQGSGFCLLDKEIALGCL